MSRTTNLQPLCTHLMNNITQAVMTMKTTHPLYPLLHPIMMVANGLVFTGHYPWAIMLYNVCLQMLSDKTVMHKVYFEAVRDGLWEVPEQDRGLFTTLRFFNDELGEEKMGVPITFVLRAVHGGFVVGVDQYTTMEQLASHLRTIGRSEEQIMETAIFLTTRIGNQICNEDGEMMNVMTIFQNNADD